MSTVIVALVGEISAEEAVAGTGALVVGTDADAVGRAVACLRDAGVDAAGFVGGLDDPTVLEMAAELFPGSEILDRRPPAHPGPPL